MGSFCAAGWPAISFATKIVCPRAHYFGTPLRFLRLVVLALEIGALDGLLCAAGWPCNWPHCQNSVPTGTLFWYPVTTFSVLLCEPRRDIGGRGTSGGGESGRIAQGSRGRKWTTNILLWGASLLWLSIERCLGRNMRSPRRLGHWMGSFCAAGWSVTGAAAKIVCQPAHYFGTPLRFLRLVVRAQAAHWRQ